MDGMDHGPEVRVVAVTVTLVALFTTDKFICVLSIVSGGARFMEWIMFGYSHTSHAASSRTFSGTHCLSE